MHFSQWKGRMHAVEVNIRAVPLFWQRGMLASMVLKKAKYHAAASILSNQVIAVLDMGYTLLEDCGFTRAEAVRATGQLVAATLSKMYLKQAVTAH